MMLGRRSTESERMDTACADYADYATCLRDLSRVNTLTLTHRPMLVWLARQMRQPDFSLLDVACGHGDGLRRIRRAFPHARLSGIDLNPWASRAATCATDAAERITYLTGDVFDYVPSPKPDFIVSSQFTHHLAEPEIRRFLAWQEQHAETGWFISDLHRHILPWSFFPLMARIAGWHRFVRQDGQISIARSFTAADWRAALSDAGLTERATITWHIPFRLCVATR